MTGLVRRRAVVTVSGLLACLVLSAGLATTASAATVATTAMKWGLIGTWALDCRAPPNRNMGSRLTYQRAPDGRLIHRRDFGDISDTNEVVAAEVTPEGLLRLTVNFPKLKDTRVYALMKQDDGSIRSMSNRGDDGTYTIKDGKFTANGRPSPKQIKCD